MSGVVIDASVTLASLLEDERTPAVMALRRRLPLATLDKELRDAAGACGVEVV